MAKMIITLEDRPEGVSLDIRCDRRPLARRVSAGSHAVRLSQQIHELVCFEMKLAAIPPHRLQSSDTVH